MGLSLIAGPASAGKVALLLERYLAALAREPVLIVPNRSDVERVERDLLELQPALLGGSIGTFDDLFTRIARGGADLRSVATESQRALIVRRALAGRSLNGLGRSARAYIAATAVKLLALQGPGGPGESWSATLAVTEQQALALIGAQSAGREIRLLPRP